MKLGKPYGIILLVLLAAGAAVAVKTFEKKPKGENKHDH